MRTEGSVYYLSLYPAYRSPYIVIHTLYRRHYTVRYNEYTTDGVIRAGAAATGDKGRSKHLSVTRRDRRANSLDANSGVSGIITPFFFFLYIIIVASLEMSVITLLLFSNYLQYIHRKSRARADEFLKSKITR